jgi:hypothetical protein
MDREVKDRVKAHADYANAFNNYNIFTMWNIARQVALGQGSVSVYAMVTRILKLKQDKEDYTKYINDFKQAASDLLRQCTHKEILTRILNTLFILGLNQEQFKDKLSTTYSQADYPAYADYAREIYTYAQNTQHVKKWNGDNDGKIQANKTTTDSTTNSKSCFNCDSKNHVSGECKKPRVRCSKCDRNHMDKFHDLLQAIHESKKGKYNEREKVENNSDNDTKRSGNIVAVIIIAVKT